MRVKVCGIRKIEDALNAVKFGADAVGLLVGQKHSAKDFIDEGTARSIVEKLPPFCSSVLVTHLTDNDKIISLAKFIGTTTIQLHGDSTPEDVMYIRQRLPGVKLIKALHVVDENSIKNGRPYLDVIDAILLDTINVSTDQVGGTGLTHDWNLSREIVLMYGVPVILAGGLNPDNVQQAIKAVNPFGVDANSGTKGLDGFKDINRLKAFIRNAKM
jgi:phosphoribosylanthranilate isomerase